MINNREYMEIKSLKDEHMKEVANLEFFLTLSCAMNVIFLMAFLVFIFR